MNERSAGADKLTACGCTDGLELDQSMCCVVLGPVGLDVIFPLSCLLSCVGVRLFGADS